MSVDARPVFQGRRLTQREVVGMVGETVTFVGYSGRARRPVKISEVLDAAVRVYPVTDPAVPHGYVVAANTLTRESETP